MDWVARALLDVILFGAFALCFLGAVYLVASYRLQRARRHGQERDAGADFSGHFELE